MALALVVKQMDFQFGGCTRTQSTHERCMDQIKICETGFCVKLVILYDQRNSVNLFCTFHDIFSFYVLFLSHVVSSMCDVWCAIDFDCIGLLMSKFSVDLRLLTALNTNTNTNTKLEITHCVYSDVGGLLSSAVRCSCKSWCLLFGGSALVLMYGCCSGSVGGGDVSLLFVDDFPRCRWCIYQEPQCGAQSDFRWLLHVFYDGDEMTVVPFNDVFMLLGVFRWWWTCPNHWVWSWFCVPWVVFLDFSQFRRCRLFHIRMVSCRLWLSCGVDACLCGGKVLSEVCWKSCAVLGCLLLEGCVDSCGRLDQYRVEQLLALVV